MSTAESVAAKEQRAQDALTALYGDEKKLIVRNVFKGIIPIAFAPEFGRGQDITRSHLPQVLTDLAPREAWLTSNDFRQAVSKGWLKVVSPEEYETTMKSESARQRELRRLAAADGDVQPSRQVDAIRERVPSQVDPEVGPQDEMDIDPDTASLVPAGTGGKGGLSLDEQRAAAERYERGDVPLPKVEMTGDSLTARAEILVDRISRKVIVPFDAIQELDRDADLYTLEDLQLIINQAKYSGVKALAQRIVSARVGQ